jgi:hypothetical protein
MLNIFKSATAAEPQTETLVSEFIANGGKITKETTTAKKKARREKKATAPETTTTAPSWADFKSPDTAPVVAETTPAVATPDLPETAALIWNIPSASAPAKKSKKAAATATDTVSARKAALAETDKTVRLEQVIALLSRPEGASLQDIQTCFWLAASAVRKMVEKAGYTTSQSGDRGAFRYHATKKV